MGSKARKWARLSTMYQKQKELAMMNENLAKVYVIGSKTVSQFSLARVRGKRGGLKNEADPL